MKKPLILFTLLFLIFHFGCADRENYTLAPSNNSLIVSELSGSISGTLFQNKSPYYITGNIKVDSSNSLVIEPGVELLFHDSTYFEIHGSLQSVGKSYSPIIFTSYDKKWRGIRVINSSKQVSIRFAIIENVFITASDTSGYGGISIINSSATIQNSIIQNNHSNFGGGISITDANVVIKNNILRNNEAVFYGGAILIEESSGEIINNTFYKNGCLSYGGGLVLVDPLQTSIQNNIFYKNTSQIWDPRISIISGDSVNYKIKYNFMPYGSNMDPQFISEDDLHLKVYSPCINAGDPNESYNDIDGSRNDQGAYGGPSGDW